MNTLSITYRAPTLAEETERVWSYISRISWYDKNKYSPDFPDSSVIHEMLEMARQGQLNAASEKQKLSQIMQGINHQNNYGKVIADLKNANQNIQKAWPIFIEMSKKWGYATFSSYEVIATRYGMEGSYDYNAGKIIVKTSIKGTEAKTVLHELFHIGIEKNIVQKYGLTQGEKERVVDQFINQRMKPYVENTEMQSIGSPIMDKYLAEPDAWDRLPEYIAQFRLENPPKAS